MATGTGGTETWIKRRALRRRARVACRQSRHGRAVVDQSPSLHERNDFAGEAVALPRIGWPQDLRRLVIGVPHRLHEIENVRVHEHFDWLLGSPAPTAEVVTERPRRKGPGQPPSGARLR